MCFVDKAVCFLIGIYFAFYPLLPDEIHVWNITITMDFAAYIIILLSLIKIIIDQKFRETLIKFFKSMRYDFINLSVFIFSLMIILSVFYSADKNLALGECIRTLSFIFIFFMLKYKSILKDNYEYFLKIFLVTSFLVFLYGPVDYLRSIFIYNVGKPLVEIRISSTMGHANNLATFALFSIFPSLMLSLKQKENKKARIFYIIVSLLGILNIFLSGSRNAMLGLIIGILLLAFIYNYKLIKLIVIFPIMLLIPQFRLRFMQIGDMNQNVSRIKIWKTVLYMIKDHPIRGIGIGNFYSLYPKYVEMHPELTDFYDKGNVYHAHNAYLKFQSELGIMGSISFLGIIFFSIKNMIKLIKTEKNKFTKYFYYGFFISLIVFLLMNIIDNFFSAPKVAAFFWTLLGIMEGRLCDITSGDELLK